MGNCFSVKNERNEHQYNPRQNRNEPSLSPTRQNNNVYPILSETPTFTTQTPVRTALQPQPQYISVPYTPQPEETIDCNGFTVLSKNPHLRYKKISVIQNDVMGKIYLAYLSDKKVAIKEFNSEKTIDYEAAILSSLDHKNIVKFVMKFEALNSRFFLVTDYAEKLIRSFHLKNDEYKKNAIMHLTSAVDYLQNEKIIHLQIIPENIFVVDHGTSCTFKLGNFSKAIRAQTKTNVQFKGIEGYTAPEIIVQKKITLASDIWSLACLFFFFATAQRMFTILYQNQMGKVNARIKAMEGETTSIILLKDLLNKMLKFQGFQRLSTADIQKHPYFWNTKEMIDLIIEISRLMEKDDKEMINILYKGSSKVLGESWVQRVDTDVITELKAIKKAFRNFNRGGPKKKEDFDEKSIKSLITTIRNISVHDRTPIIIYYMGDNHEHIMNYWNSKFPYLIEHIYNAKLQYDNKENFN